jgi:glycosyltransferase involved in cell wall biosynthesis
MDISAIILTKDEEIHIERCIKSVCQICSDIYVVDSFSTDKTCEIAKTLGAHVYQHKWENNYSKQFNWGLENLPIKTEWVLRQDADEYMSPDLIQEIKDKLPKLPQNVSGVTMRCLRIFMDKEIKHGILPLILLRLFKKEGSQCEVRLMDEHIQVDGDIVRFEEPFYDHNLNGLTWWTQKHNGYATREAIDLLDTEYNLSGELKDVHNTGAHSSSIRRKKMKYVKLPLFWRAFAFFCLRYFIRLGFLDGKEGFLWHFLQGFWYRTLADAKVYEVKKACGNDRKAIRKYIQEHFGYEL